VNENEIKSTRESKNFTDDKGGKEGVG